MLSPLEYGFFSAIMALSAMLSAPLGALLMLWHRDSGRLLFYYAATPGIS
ncbi:MAG: hypothetical protein Q7S71_05470 [Candidatus Nitrotoga sp.]|nr:hypothetical protein [Candidatus Nitrotoga sp.]